MQSSSARLLSAVILITLACPVRAAKYEINWYLGHPNLDYFEEAAASFKRTVESESRGDISVKIIKASSDGPRDSATQSPAAPEIAGMVERGEAEMGHSYVDVMGPVEPAFRAFEAPYLFRGYRHMEGVIEGPIGEGLLAGLGTRGLVGLSFTYSGGANGIASVDREIRGPEDLKGLKVGVYGDAVDEAWLKSLGATPVPVRHDLGSLAQLKRNGEIDAVSITWRNLEQAALGHDFKRFSLEGSSYLVSVTYINAKFYRSLPRNYQRLLMRASREAGRIERARTIQLNATAKREMLAQGVQSVPLTKASRSRFIEAVRPVYAAVLDATLGAGLADRIRGVADAPTAPFVPADFATR